MVRVAAVRVLDDNLEQESHFGYLATQLATHGKQKSLDTPDM